jgi:hypothetical protein
MSKTQRVKILSISDFAELRGVHCEAIRWVLNNQGKQKKRGRTPILLDEERSEISGRRIGIKMNAKAHRYLARQGKPMMRKIKSKKGE